MNRLQVLSSTPCLGPIPYGPLDMDHGLTREVSSALLGDTGSRNWGCKGAFIIPATTQGKGRRLIS